MLQDIIAVKLLQNTKLHLRFEDNQEGIVDIQQQIQSYRPIIDQTS